MKLLICNKEAEWTVESHPQMAWWDPINLEWRVDGEPDLVFDDSRRGFSQLRGAFRPGQRIGTAGRLTSRGPGDGRSRLSLGPFFCVRRFPAPPRQRWLRANTPPTSPTPSQSAFIRHSWQPRARFSPHPLLSSQPGEVSHDGERVCKVETACPLAWTGPTCRVAGIASSSRRRRGRAEGRSPVLPPKSWNQRRREQAPASLLATS